MPFHTETFATQSLVTAITTNVRRPHLIPHNTIHAKANHLHTEKSNSSTRVLAKVTPHTQSKCGSLHRTPAKLSGQRQGKPHLVSKGSPFQVLAFGQSDITSLLRLSYQETGSHSFLKCRSNVEYTSEYVAPRSSNAQSAFVSNGIIFNPSTFFSTSF